MCVRGEMVEGWGLREREQHMIHCDTLCVQLLVDILHPEGWGWGLRGVGGGLARCPLLPAPHAQFYRMGLNVCNCGIRLAWFSSMIMLHVLCVQSVGMMLLLCWQLTQYEA